MSERANRFISGFSLIAFLFLEWNYGVIALLSILLFEGLTNWRIPALVSSFRYATDGSELVTEENNVYRYSYEAERLLRFSVAMIIILGFILFTESLWFLPYCIGLNLLLAGITGVCPLLMLYRKLGFR